MAATTAENVYGYHCNAKYYANMAMEDNDKLSHLLTVKNVHHEKRENVA